MNSTVLIWVAVIAYFAWAIPKGFQFMEPRWPAAWKSGGLGIKVVKALVSAFVGIAFGYIFAALWLLKFILRLTTGR